MINLADFVCTEQQQQLSQTTTALTLSSDSRRLTTFLNQEERFMPNNYQTTKQVRNYEEERARVLELIYEVLYVYYKIIALVYNYYTILHCILCMHYLILICMETVVCYYLSCNSHSSNVENADPCVCCVTRVKGILVGKWCADRQRIVWIHFINYHCWGIILSQCLDS